MSGLQACCKSAWRGFSASSGRALDELFASSDGKLVMVCKYTETGVPVDCIVTLK